MTEETQETSAAETQEFGDVEETAESITIEESGNVCDPAEATQCDACQ